jgi:hypothetical protein
MKIWTVCIMRSNLNCPERYCIGGIENNGIFFCHILELKIDYKTNSADNKRVKCSHDDCPYRRQS